MAFESQAGLYINIKSRNIYTWYKYKLGIPFAEHNFGSLGCILFLLVLFER